MLKKYAALPKVVITGGAGFVGRNLILELLSRGYRSLAILDKNRSALRELRATYPDLVIEYADLGEDPLHWRHHFQDAGLVVMLQAQIGGHSEEAFVRNNITSTRNVLEAIRHHATPYLVHVSSSVVTQAEDDHYSRTKRGQEQAVTESGMDCVVLRPTLMFGRFNINHLAWLARLMRKVHIMPVPGNGKFIRQPLYVDDFCRVIATCMDNRPKGKVFNISGLERIYYIDCLRLMRRAMGITCPIIRIPYSLFFLLIKLWALLTKNAAFNSEQLKALCAGDVFEVIDWPGIFHTQATPLDLAFERTFGKIAAGGCA